MGLAGHRSFEMVSPERPGSLIHGTAAQQSVSPSKQRKHRRLQSAADDKARPTTFLLQLSEWPMYLSDLSKGCRKS